jgi:hypothetical protein
MQPLMNRPIIESAAGAAIGALLARLAAGSAIRTFGDKRYVDDPDYHQGLKRASWLIGAAAGGLNPFLRDADYDTPASFFRSMWAGKGAASGEFDPTPFLGTIDKSDAFGIVRNDTFMKPYEKVGVLGLVRSASEPDPGKTSTFGLAQSAIRAGIAFVPAYAFGSLVGKALGLPSDVSKQLSRMGALAYAVRASGITEYLR